MCIIFLNLAFKIANLDIFFIVVTIATIVATIIVSKILMSSWQCCDKPKSTGEVKPPNVRPVPNAVKSSFGTSKPLKQLVLADENKAYWSRLVIVITSLDMKKYFFFNLGFTVSS